MAQIEGTITAHVVLAPDGLVHSVTTQVSSKFESAKALMPPTVEKVIRDGVYRSDCGGRTITLIFDFKIAGDSGNPPQKSISFGAPNRFWIVTERLPMMINPAHPSPH